VGLLRRIFGTGGDEAEEAKRSTSKEDALAAYIIREHKQGRSIEDIIDDPYLKNRTTDEARVRLLERPDVIRAVGDEVAKMAQSRARGT
jgi:hypothetical protein